MKCYPDIIQGTEAWLRLRMGKPTASQFFRIITPSGKPSTSMDGYVNELLAEMMLGRPLLNPQTMAMAAGTEREPEARAYYEFLTETEVQQVGFCTTDDGTIGASPDGFVGDNGLLELKNPEIETHISYLLGGKGVDGKYKTQAQGQLYVCEREWVDIVSYYPGLPHALVRMSRDEKYLELMDVELKKCVELLAARREKLMERGWIVEPKPERDYSSDFLTDADTEAILAYRRLQRQDNEAHTGMA